MDDLVTWLRAQLDEDERAAREATQAEWWHNPRKQWLDAEAFVAYDLAKGEEFVGYGESPFSACIAATGPADHPQSAADARHIARWDPVRVLAEVDAKRRILDDYELWAKCHDPARAAQFVGTTSGVAAMLRVVHLLALPYADRPGYREEWRPC